MESVRVAGGAAIDPEDMDRAICLCMRVAEALARGVRPRLSEEGSGGTYVLKDLAVFKPLDEEAFAPLNPRGHVGALGSPSLRRGIRSGEAAQREVAAYRIDRGGVEGVCAGVPLTVIGELQHPALSYPMDAPALDMKKGSLQEFVLFDEIAGDLSPKFFPVKEVHKIAVLDIRLVNSDRNDGNILVRKTESGSLKLVPIDHGYILPDVLEIAWCDWVWLDWPHVKQPFSLDMLNLIEDIDIERDAAVLRSLDIREECILNMKATTTLLKKGAKAGMTLHQIAKVICRDNLDAPSLLEMSLAQARVLASKCVELKMKSPTKSTKISPLELMEVSESSGCEPRRSSASSAELLQKVSEVDLLEFLNLLLDELVSRKCSGGSSKKRGQGVWGRTESLIPAGTSCYVARSFAFGPEIASGSPQDSLASTEDDTSSGLVDEDAKSLPPGSPGLFRMSI